MGEAVVYEDRMSDSDALMWNMERDPVLRSTIVGAWLLDCAPDRSRLRERAERALHHIPRLRQRVAANPFSIAPPRWEVDPDFDLDFHLRFARVARGGGLRELLDFAQPIAMQGFDRDRPLWELHVVEELADGRAGIVMKLHHAVSDGVGLVQMMGRLMETWRTPDPARAPRALPPLPEPTYKGIGERFLDALGYERRKQVGRALGVLGALRTGLPDALRSPLGAGRELAEALASVGRMLQPVSEPLSPLMRGRSLRLHLDALSVPLARLRAAAKRAGGTLNDAFVAGVVEGLRRYHERHGVAVERLRTTMPINVREGEKGRRAGNQFVPARFEVPADVLDPVERMRRIGETVRRQRAEPALPFLDEVSSLLNRFPAAVSTQLLGGMLKGVDFVTSNVPGPQIDVYASGALIEEIYGFGPLSGAAANVTLFSYRGGCGIGIHTDQRAVPDPETFRACLGAGLEQVLDLGAAA
jgi:WS/DGAT/MGAT family acyltransferase